MVRKVVDCAPHVIGCVENIIKSKSDRDQMNKNGSSGKTDSQEEKRSSGSPILLKIVSENRFSGKTYFYTIASSALSHEMRYCMDPQRNASAPLAIDPRKSSMRSPSSALIWIYCRSRS